MVFLQSPERQLVHSKPWDNLNEELRVKAREGRCT